MICKTKIEKIQNIPVQPVQYWLSDDVEFRLCNVKGMTRNGSSTYSTPSILIIKHTTRNKTIDISIPFKKAHDIIDIINDFIDSNSDVLDEN